MYLSILLTILISFIVSVLVTIFCIFNNDLLSIIDVSSILGSILGVLGAYWIFNLGNIKKDKDDLEHFLLLLKFLVIKIDRVMNNPQNIISDRSVNFKKFSYDLVYDKDWPKYLRLIKDYEDKENIIKFIDFIQRDQNLVLWQVLEYRENIINILKKYNRYDSSLDISDELIKMKQ